MVALDVAHRKWVVLFEETGATSPIRQAQAAINSSPEGSPLPRYSVAGSSTVKRFDTYGKQGAAPGSSLKDFHHRPSTVQNFHQTPMKSNAKMINLRSMQGENQTPSLEASPMRPGTTMGTSTAKKRRPRIQTGNQHGTGHQEKEHVELSSPTSISMKNSYIIKNADPSFDAYYKSMNRRTKLLSQAANTMGGSIQMG